MTLLDLKDLETHLWEAAHIITGPIDASDYKTYIFPILFFKRICDVYDEELEKAIKETGGDAEMAKAPMFHRIDIPDGCHWDDVIAKTQDVGHHLKEAFNKIEQANDNLYGIFGDASWTNKERLSDELLITLLSHFNKYHLAKHISKRVEPSETTLEIYVGLEHLDPDSLKITRHGVPSDVAGQKLLVKKGQIIFGKRRAYQRKVAVADWDCICSAHAMVLEAIPGKILPEFLPFFMQSHQFMERAVEISEGSLSPTIKWKILEQQIFKIPVLDRQNDLIRILLKYEEIEKKQTQTLSSFIQLERVTISNFFAQNKSQFFSLGELTNSGDILDIQDGNHGEIHPKASDYQEEGIPFVMASDIKNGEVDIVNAKKIKKDLADKLRIGFSYEGDVLLSHKGTVGSVAITPKIKDYVMLTPQITYYRVSPKSRILNNYLAIYFKTEEFQSKLKILAAQSTRAYIGITAQKKICIPVPDIQQQNELIQICKKMERYKCLLKKKIDTSKNIARNLING